MATYFVGGTEIQLFDGSVKKIEDVIIGDVLLSVDEFGNRTSITVDYTNEVSFDKDDVKILTLSTGRDIVTHVDSKIVIIGKGKRYVWELEEGDICIDFNGTQCTVVDVTPVDEEHGLFEGQSCGLFTIEFEGIDTDYYSETILVSI